MRYKTTLQNTHTPAYVHVTYRANKKTGIQSIKSDYMPGVSYKKRCKLIKPDHFAALVGECYFY